MNNTPTKKDKYMKIVFRILVVVWMIVIFCFSSATGKESSKTSHEVGMAIGEVVVPDFDELPKPEQDRWAEKIDYPIRKAAHASEYALLALLIFGALGKDGFFDRRKYSRYLWSLLFTALYAGTDEIHQLFVPERAGTLFDVGVDSLGAAVGLLILLLIRKMIRRRKDRSEPSSPEADKDIQV